jgi:hypothetical protein
VVGGLGKRVGYSEGVGEELVARVERVKRVQRFTWSRRTPAQPTRLGSSFKAGHEARHVDTADKTRGSSATWHEGRQRTKHCGGGNAG